MKNIILALMLCSFCSYAQIPTESLPDEKNGYEVPENEVTEAPEEDEPEEDLVKLPKRKRKGHIGLMAGAGLTGGNPDHRNEDFLSPVIGAAAYHQFTKRSAVGLDVLYYKDLLIVPHYRWMYENLYLKVGTYYTEIFSRHIISQYREFNFEKGVKGSIGCQFNQMKWKPFAELQIFGLSSTDLDSYIFIMTGGIMF